MKKIARLLICLLLLTTVVAPLNISYAAGEFTVPPRTVSYDPATSGGTLTFEFQVSQDYPDNVVYWVVTPDTVTLSAIEIQSESAGNTYPGGSLGYKTSLEQVTVDNVPAGGKYKLHYVISNNGSLLQDSQGEVLFELPIVKLTSAVYDDGIVSDVEDDSISITFDGVVTNPGVASDYEVAIDTHSIDSFDSSDILLTEDDYKVNVKNEGVILNFTASGIAKLPTSGLSFWRVSIVNPNNLTPNVDMNERIANFSRNIKSEPSAQLAQILIGGIPLVGFEPNRYEYGDVEIPYSYVSTLAGDYSSLISGISTTGQTIQAVHDADLNVEKIIVTEQGKQSSTYYLYTSINNMSLSDIKVGGQPILGFNKFLKAFSMPVSAALTEPPLLTVTADNPSAVVTVSGSGSLPGQYYYTIKVTFGQDNKEYTVALYSQSQGGSSGSGGNHTSPTVESNLPKGVTTSDLRYLDNLLGMNDPILVSQNVSAALNNTLMLKDESTLFLSLTKLDDMVGSIAENMKNTSNPDVLLKDVVKTSQVVEQKIQNLSNPQDALTVVEQYLEQLSKVKTNLNESELALEKSASKMLQKISDQASTVSVIVPPNQNTLKIDSSAVDKAIAKQINFLGKINKVSDQYFGEESINRVSTQIVLDVKKPENSSQLATTIPTEIVQKLGDNGVEKIKVQMGNAGMTFNNDELSKKEDLTIEMKFLENPVASEEYQNNKKVVEFNVYQGQTNIESYEKPIELSFKYESFGIKSSDALDSSIFRYNEVLKDWEPVGGILDPQSGEIRVKRTHLSQYTVMKSKKSFSDINNSSAKSEINSLLNKGVIKNTDRFEPKAYLTRGEFSSWMANAFGLQSKDKILPFKDVDVKNENYSAIAAVYGKGLISGKSKTKFDPDGFITEQEMSVVMSSALVAFEDKKSNSKTKYKHLEILKEKDVASWAQEDVALLLELGVKNNKNLAKGDSLVTKETAAAVFSRLYN